MRTTLSEPGGFGVLKHDDMVLQQLRITLDSEFRHPCKLV